MTRARTLLLASTVAATVAVGAFLGPSNIDPAHKFSWGENIGWMNWRDADGTNEGVLAGNDFLTGFVWGENVGWINVGDGAGQYPNATGLDFGVNILGSGDLEGYAWSENKGWINFGWAASTANPDRARFDSTASRFRGYAWGENAGWINLDDSTHYVAKEPPSVVPPEVAAAPLDAPTHRYLPIDPSTNGSTPVAYQVQLVSMKRCDGDLSRACRVDPDCNGGATGPCLEHPSVPADLGYVQEPYTVPSGCSPLACGPTDVIARVDSAAVFRVWPESTLHIGDCEITPIATYEIRATTDGATFSAPLVIATIQLPELSPGFFGGFGDIAESPIGGQYQPPGRIGNIVDVSCYVNTIQNYPLIDPLKPWAHKTWPDLEGLGTGSPPNYIVNAADLQSILNGLQDKKWLDHPDHRYPVDCPPNCGDGYCDADAGEDPAGCPADCP